MEKLKKVFAFILALIVSVGMGVTAFADTDLLSAPKQPEVKIKIAGEGKGTVTLYYGGGKTFTVTDESDKKEGKIALAEGTEMTLSIETGENTFIKKVDGDFLLGETFTMGRKNAEVTVTFSDKTKEKKDNVLTAENGEPCVEKDVKLTVLVDTHGKGWIAESVEIYEKTEEGDVRLGNAVLEDGVATFTVSGKTEAKTGVYYAVTLYEQKNVDEHNHYEAFISNNTLVKWNEHDWDEGTLNEAGDTLIHHCKNEGCEETKETPYKGSEPEHDPDPKPEKDPEPAPAPEREPSKDSTTIVIGEKDEGGKKDSKEENPHTGAPVFDMGMAAVLAVAVALVATVKTRRH